MATLRSKRKLTALNRKNHEEYPRSTLAQNTHVPESQEDYITQVSGEIEGRVTKKLSKVFSRTESPILGALSRLDEFLLSPLIQGHFLSPLIQGHSGSAPETSRNAYGVNRGTNEDDSQSDSDPEAKVSQSQTTQNSGPNDAYYISLWKFVEFSMSPHY